MSEIMNNFVNGSVEEALEEMLDEMQEQLCVAMVAVNIAHSIHKNKINDTPNDNGIYSSIADENNILGEVSASDLVVVRENGDLVEILFQKDCLPCEDVLQADVVMYTSAWTEIFDKFMFSS